LGDAGTRGAAGAALALRAVALLAVAVALGGCGGDDAPPTVEETGRWELSAPADEGIDPEQIERLDRQVRARSPELTSLLVARHGRLVFERYYNGSSARDRFTIWSVTKSVTSALVGIALKEGKLKSVDQRLVDLAGPIPNGADPQLDEIRLRDLLTMTAGFTLEGSPTAQVGGIEYTRDPNWTSYLLRRDMTSHPGTRFTYDNGVTHLVSIVLTRATGMPAAAYARTRLFRPLRIDELVFWPSDPQRNTHGAFGLQLHARDLAKLGELYLREGRWGDKQIVPAEYVRRSTRTHVHLGTDEGYGYFWWIADAKPRSFAAFGYGGQSIIVTPSLDLVVVTTANGSDWDVRELFERIILPAITG
jgi:CubicO group peptidase (beta-lactamase class C family)